MSNITLQYLFLVHSNNILNLESASKPTKTIYAELFELLKKAINYAINTKIYSNCLISLKSYSRSANNNDTNNPNITRYKERYLNQLKSNIKQNDKAKQHLRNSTCLNKLKSLAKNSIENESNIKVHKYKKCKQSGHYAKIYSNK
ncbi:1802_t:CDS:2 [Racocetra fulgida]|uniref:1802_t:CDS:1 n=1 Tax=Racocetra fulgida TaxID=60492 RepID=A0A9N8ZNF4_9GLOM|nr:1802_t:CDS:2 [Racocetra fulgida]